jgi:hypothetical protein
MKTTLCLVCREYQPTKGFKKHAENHSVEDVERFRYKPIPNPHAVELGRLGGNKTKETQGQEHYFRMAKLATKVRKANAKARKENGDKVS